jgi:hypothetical protein
MSQATHRQPLDKALRRALEATVVKARDIAELAASQALTRLSVGEAKAADYLNDQQRQLRTRLRAHGRQLGDSKQASGQQSLNKLITEVAYEHWHRMLFARFLEQNHLLMYDEHTPLTLSECSELVQDPDTLRDELERRCHSGWELAGVLASKMLPQIFRIDSPVFALEFAPEHQRELEKLVTGLAPETFQAQDSLGWVYQFWQSKRKEEVNKSEVKIGADELSPVTQLFTEPYMVSFLLDNSLGAWWAGQRLTDLDWQTAQNEQELREKAAIPGVPLSYLRFVKSEDTQQWQPASGTFDAWPKNLSELKALDPCCGSGHFLVAAFLMLVPMRMEREGLSTKEAVDAVLRENIHGLELDQRCVELAAFALALTAWKYSGSGGYRVLPQLNVACSGLSISAKKGDWLALAGDNSNLRFALDELHEQFKDAPILGSLINPETSLGKGSLFELKWEEVGPLLTKVLAGEMDEEKAEMGVVACGLVTAADLLSKKYQLVCTNVPFLGEIKQSDNLRMLSESVGAHFKIDLAYTMLARVLDFCASNGVVSLVMPMDWLVQTKSRQMRKHLYGSYEVPFLVKLGRGAFQYQVGKDVMLFQLKNCIHNNGNISVVDFTSLKSADAIQNCIGHSRIETIRQADVVAEKNNLITGFPGAPNLNSLGEYCDVFRGLSTGDSNRFYKAFHEISALGEEWEFLRQTSSVDSEFAGMCDVVYWQKEKGDLALLAESLKDRNHAVQSWRRGKPFWGRRGVSVNRMGSFRASLYLGERYSENAGAIIPKIDSMLEALWCYFSSDLFIDDLKKLTHKLDVEPRYLKLLSFDLAHWTKVAEENYPNGLPNPYTNDPTQWIFHGHPCGSVIWDEDRKWTVIGDLRVDHSVLQVAVARLLGYRWPSELDPEMELAAEQREWVERSQALAGFVDDDGIVCLPPVRGEKTADQRLESLLQAAYGDAWTTPLKNRLLEAVGSKSLSLWLRDKFFEQHSKLFQHRPFVWHIWDGLKDGFSVLVNYHKLDRAGLERLIYTYLGDWIRTQQSGLGSGEDGAQERLSAAEALKKELEAVLEGEKPYDIFVRWKPLAEQPIGWTPDINDGVRLNIRPFLKARDVGKKGAGILRWAPNINWNNDRGKDVDSAPWYRLGLEYGEGEGARINDHHLSLTEKRAARS